MNEMKRIEKEISEGKANVNQTILFGNFPMSRWKEWEVDCVKNYNGCRWMKAYSDHLKARNSEEMEAIWKKLAEIETMIKMAESKEEEPEGVRNLSGELIE